MKQKYFNQETKKLFVETSVYEFNKLKKNENLIFSDLNYNLDTDKIFDEFLESENGYQAYLTIPKQEQKEFMKKYFLESIIVPAFDEIHGAAVNNKIKQVEESTGTGFLGFDKEIRLKNTVNYLLENVVFYDLPKDVKSQLTENILNIREEALEYLLEDIAYGSRDNIVAKTYDAGAEFLEGLLNNIIGFGKTIKEALIFLVVFFYSPFMIIASENNKYRFLGTYQKGIIKQTLELIGPCRFLGELLLSPYKDIGEVLKNTNEFNSPDIKDFLRDISKNKTTPETIINDCWVKNARALPEETQMSLKNSMHAIAAWIKTGRMQWIGHPADSGPGLLGWLFSIDADDQSFQRSYFEFRKCTYDHIFDIIIGYAKIAMEVDESNSQVIETIKNASRRKDYHFFDRLITQTTDKKELLIYKVGKALLAIDEIAENLKQNKRILYQDKYIDQFYIYLKQKIKQAFLDLDEIAEKRTAEADPDDVKNDDNKYDENWKNVSLKVARDGKKPQKQKSIYEM